MIKRMSIWFCFIFLFVCYFVSGSMAEIYSEEMYGIKSSNTLTPFYLTGHENDETQIAGFYNVQDIFLKGLPGAVASRSLTMTLVEPPLDLNDEVILAKVEGTMDIPGLGAFDQSGYIVIMTNRETIETGFVWVSFSNSMKGTAVLEGIYSLVTSWGEINLNSPGDLTDEIWRYRFEY